MNKSVFKKLLLFLTVITVLQTSNIEAQDILNKNPIISFRSSYISYDHSVLALGLSIKKSGKVKKIINDLAFLNLKTGEMFPQTIYSVLPEQRNRYVEIDSFSWDGITTNKVVISRYYVEIDSFSWDPKNLCIYFTLQDLESDNYVIKNNINKIFKYDITTSSVDTITINAKQERLIYPVISSNSKQIVVIGYDKLQQKDSGIGTLYLYNLETSQTKVLVEHIDLYRPIISFDNKKIIYKRNGDLYIKRLDTGKEKRLTNLNKELQIISVYWDQNGIYFVTRKPPFSKFITEMKNWLENEDKGEEPSYFKELWHIPLEKEFSIQKIMSFRTMKLGTHLYKSSLLISLPNDIGGANIWKYDLKEKKLIQLTFGKNIDDLPIGISEKQRIIFRRNLTEIYSIDIYGKQKPARIY